MTRSDWAQCRSCGEDLRGAPLRCPICGADNPVTAREGRSGPQTIARALFSTTASEPADKVRPAPSAPTTKFEPAPEPPTSQTDPAPEPRPSEGPRRFAGGPFGPALARRRQEAPAQAGPAPATGELGGVSRDTGAVTVVQPDPDPSLRAGRDTDEAATHDKAAGTQPEPVSARIAPILPRGTDAEAETAPEVWPQAPANDASASGGEASEDEEEYEDYENGEEPDAERAPRKLRGGALVVASRRSRELAPAAAKQGASVVRRLIRLTTMALILLSILGAANWWMQNNNLGLDLGLDPTSLNSGDTAPPTEAATAIDEPSPADSELVRADPEENWFVLLAGDESFDHAVLRSNAPVRLRIEGDAILLPANRSLRVTAAAVPVEVRAIRADTEIEVTRIEDTQ